MKNTDLHSEADDLYKFSDEEANEKLAQNHVWKLLMVSFDVNICSTINMLSKDFTFLDKKIHILEAPSIEDAQKDLMGVPDIAMLMLPITTQDQQIEAFIKLIREQLKNSIVRIILYSDDSCDGIERLFIKYDISDYLTNDQLNITKLYSVFSSCLRMYGCLQQQHINEDRYENMLATINHFIPQTFLKILGKKDISEINLTDHVEKKVAVLFFDIRGFTSLSELLTPLETFDFINNFISYLEPHIAANKGYIDKYIGDSFMALFPENADDAIKAGINMLRSLEIYNYQRIIKYQTAVKIGIGINTGEAVMGVIGFYDRMECTAVSSAVNAASRLEGLTKTLGANLLISDSTFKNLQNPEQFNLRSLGNVKAIGRREIIHVFEVFDADPEESQNMKQKTKSEFEQGVALIQNGDLSLANKIFGEIIRENAHDLPAKYFFEKTNKKPPA